MDDEVLMTWCLAILVVVFFMVFFALGGCDKNDADIASHNLSKSADQFEIDRRVVFYNGITDKYILTITGKCSIFADRADEQLEVTCKVSDGTAPHAYKKHFLGLSDNVTYFAEQLKPRGVSVYHYKVIFKPQSVIPDIDFRSDAGELLKSVTPPDDKKN